MNIAQLESALVKAHQAGNAGHAQILADEIRNQQKLTNSYALDGNAKDDSGLTQFVGGAKHAWDKAAYGLEGAVKSAFGQDIDPAHKEQLTQGKAYVDNTGKSSSVGEFVGDAIPYVATGVAGAGGKFLTRALGQAATGAIVTPGDALDRAKAAAWGAGGEGLGQIFTRSLARLAKPVNPSEAAQRLIDQGVYPTPGAAAGGFAKKVEDKLTSLPFVGDAIEWGRRKAIEQGNAAAISRGGVDVPHGYAGFKAMDDSFSRRFPDATKDLRFDINDPAFAQSIQDALRNKGVYKDGIDDVAQFFDNLKTNNGLNPTPTAPPSGSTALRVPSSGVAIPDGTAGARGGVPPAIMGGDDFHLMLQELRKRGQQMRNAGGRDARTGDAYREIYNSADSALGTQGLSPMDAVDKFRDVRADWAKYMPAKIAGESNVTARNGGIFTPITYSNAVSNNAKKMGNTAQVRHGEAMNQQFANDMVEVLGNSYADSGTAGRYLMGRAATDIIGGGITHALGVTAPMIGAGGIAAVANTNPGRKYMVGAVSNKQKLIADYIRSKSDIGGTLGAAYEGAKDHE